MNVLRPVAIYVGSRPWLPKLAKYVVGADRLLIRLTRGRVTLAGLAGLPELTLTVTGRRTGLPRSVPVLYVPHEGCYLVAGSNWGGPTLPAWVHNLEAAGEAEVRIRDRPQSVRARRVRGEERARLWSVMVRTWPNYDKYAARTSREIPVFELEVVEVPGR